MDIEGKSFDILTWKNIYFSTYPPPTLILLSCRFISASKPQLRNLLTVVSATSHLRFNLFAISETFATKVATSRPSYEMLYGTDTPRHKQETFIDEYPLH
jgi:hypothetical protein